MRDMLLSGLQVAGHNGHFFIQGVTARNHPAAGSFALRFRCAAAIKCGKQSTSQRVPRKSIRSTISIADEFRHAICAV
jgi:hypothetical protein